MINALSARANSQIDPATETPDGRFFDVNGDYQVTALDALQVINQIAREASNTEADTEQVLLPAPTDGNEDEDTVAGLFDVAIATMF